MSSQAEPSQAPAIIRLSGELNSLTSPRLRERLNDCVQQGQHQVLVDLAEVPFIDSSGLSALVAGLKALKLSGGRLALVGLQPQARTIFQLTQADALFALFETEPAAHAYLAGA